MTYSVRRSSKTLTALVFLFVLLLLQLLHVNPLFAQDGIDKTKWNAGKAAFKSNCASCHKVKEKMTGPALEGVLKRWEDKAAHQGKTGKEWLYVWIRNWEDAASSGNAYANEIKNYDPSAMNKFPNLTDEQIDGILLYVDNSSIGEPTATVTPPVGESKGSAEAKFPYAIVVTLIVILLFILFALNRVSHNLSNLVDEMKGIEVKPQVPFYQTRNFAIIAGMFVTVVFFFFLVKNAIDLGRSQGYQPEQPIKFSHALHAGTHKIDCQYCHSSASKSKHSNIPSVNTCMNCHKVVQKGPKYGTEEIAKIYKYADYNPDSRMYGSNAKPIEWVRIHNLPDHVYFNHAQHVKVGGQACQNCHGPIEEMEEVYQYAPLSMGWCINCHRQTKVNFEGNEYYKSYEAYHAAMKSGKMKQVTVENIGGTECQKCHY